KITSRKPRVHKPRQSAASDSRRSLRSSTNGATSKADTSVIVKPASMGLQKSNGFGGVASTPFIAKRSKQVLMAKNTEAVAARTIAFFCDTQFALEGRYTSSRLPNVTSSIAPRPSQERWSPVIHGDRISKNNGFIE